ncbi:MAG: hypothetical protein GF418_15960 [Chitinivibrionales bacterium]|nr:hypothetical protein [Chitinivibrionales bacterium]MBD3397116.1 hypothetical protein [Chitinivibrionales bacterium]
MYNPHDPTSVEKYSSAVTLSDMEVFIFPELMYSLVLANIMSPVLWRWREDPWFSKHKKMSAYRRIHRTKQYIMDNFSFNLDLDTWGLTTKERELARFSGYIDEQVLAQSNALFGYEGDKYYFDIDIRRHFGLDKYDSNVIPYWKTETIEAMEAFRFKPGYPAGAGECVSLAALYAGALRVTANIPLKDIYLMATPLHSQNLVAIKDGILTNNRRIVTRNMWFNGTELSGKARRALENERVTIVMNNAGYVHALYDEATMPPQDYRRFSGKLREYLKTDVSFEVLASFLRSNSKLQNCFQIVHACCGKPRYIEAEKVYAYEHGSKARVGDATEPNLLHEIDEDEYYTGPLPDRILLSEIEAFFTENHVSVDNPCNVKDLKANLHHSCYNVEEVVADLLAFANTEPRLPDTGKRWTSVDPVALDGLSSREEVIEYLESVRDRQPVADLAFTAYRDMTRAPWKPFLKAAFERNPVSVGGSQRVDFGRVARKLWMMPNESIYDGPRMAQPDEVWNYGRGDGLEKAICLMNVIKNRGPDDEVRLDGDIGEVRVVHQNREYAFQTSKKLELPAQEDFSF